MKQEIRKHILLFCGGGLAVMIITTPIADTKADLAWIRYGYMGVLAVGLLVALLWKQEGKL